MKTLAFAVCFAVGAAAVAQASPPAQDRPPAGNDAQPPGAKAQPPMDIPDKFTNLKILPKDIKKEALVHTMRAFSQSLGVRCDHCHVLQPDKKDFASDAKGEKQMARGMMKMVHRINEEFFTYKDAPKATCFMCHHGEHKPVLSPQAANGPGTSGGPHPGVAPPGTPGSPAVAVPPRDGAPAVRP